MEPGRSIPQAFSKLIACLRSTHPPIDIEFNPGTTIEKIREAELKLNVTFPSQLSELLLLANGQKRQKCDSSEYDFLLPEIRFGSSCKEFYSAFSFLCGIHEIVENTILNREIRTIIRSSGYDVDDPEDPYEKFGPVTVHDSIIVISTTENPAMICMDLDPPAAGTNGQIVALNDQPNSAGVLASDLIQYLEILTAGYSSGRFYRFCNFWTERPDWRRK